MASDRTWGEGVKQKNCVCMREDSLGRVKLKKEKEKEKEKGTDYWKFLRWSHISIWMNRKETSRVINALEKSCWDMARPGSQQKKGAFKVVNWPRLRLKERGEEKRRLLARPHKPHKWVSNLATRAFSIHLHWVNPSCRPGWAV